MPDWDSLSGDSEIFRLYRRINDTAVPYPAHSVSTLFEQRAAASPQRTAVEHGEHVLTYGELNGRANVLARRLRTEGVRHGDAVGVTVERSAELVIALLAILKCGAAYLPFDTAWPAERLRQLTAASGCRHVVGKSQVDSALGTAPDPPATTGPDDIAYINFTSGSTGNPKGVPIRHRGIVRLLHEPRYARLDSHSRVPQLAPATFDAATFEIWGPLLHGGQCVVYPSAHVTVGGLRRVLRNVTVAFFTTALFNTIIDEAPAILDDVATVLTGGEAHSLAHIRKGLARYGPDKLVSVYGPTETTTFASYYPIRSVAEDEPALPIGLPIQNTRLYIANDGRLCGPGEIGEVLLAGPGLSPGYLGLPRITAERFVPARVNGRMETLYRTGDRAWLRDDGNAVFQGRLDDQVKIHGYRIELGEIVHHLHQHPGVKQCYVAVASAPGGTKSLRAFVVPMADTTTTQLRDHLRARLPAYMIPSGIHLTARFPLTATGKVDRAALLREVQP